MRFLLDHDVPAEVGQLLRYWGHDVQQVREVLAITSPDEAVFAHAQTSGRVIVSCNRSVFEWFAVPTAFFRTKASPILSLAPLRFKVSNAGTRTLSAVS